ncbi:MAG: hypothetical protein AAF939_07760 [Planctomycetota bacterium]
MKKQTTWVALVLLTSFLIPRLGLGQQGKYYPDHPEVEALATRLLNGLKARPLGTNGEGVLAALAMLQHAKRYRQLVPKDDPIIKKIVEETAAEIREGAEDSTGSKSLTNSRELYHPSLAVILLCEYDARKYQEEIKIMLKSFTDRQRPNGAFTYLEKKNTGDTSQTQYVALALFVAKQNGFKFDPEIAKRVLDWLCASQQNDGTWRYLLSGSGKANDPGRPDGASRRPTLSIQAAAAGTAYLLADLLQLKKRAKNMTSNLIKNPGLPRTVIPHIKPLNVENPLKKEGPLVSFDRGKLSAATSAGNRWLEGNYTVDIEPWNFYYLYAFERYAYFREQAEGDIGKSRMTKWYDQSVEHIKSLVSVRNLVEKSGSSNIVTTAFSILVLVRSSEILVMPVSNSQLDGDVGFPTDVVLSSTQGKITASTPEKNLDDLLSMLSNDDLKQEQLQQLASSLKKQVVEFRQRGEKSRSEIKSFLRSMIGAKNYFRRLIAVRFLAGEQDMDNVPALLYALGDPDFRICLEAHNGLRLVSRKIDSLTLSPDAVKNATRDPVVFQRDPALESRLRIEFSEMKKKWTDWYLKIRPDAELLD